MKYFIFSLLENIGPEAFWGILGRKPAQLFGRECAGSALWMFFTLSLRSLCRALKFTFLPNGVIFAFPIFFQVFSIFFPFMKETVPLLIIRLAESILGRLSPSQLLIVFPAHFLGCILGAYFFCAVCPYHLMDFRPMVNEETAFSCTLVELVVVSVFTVLFIIIPELLHNNRVSKNWLSLILLPCYFIPTISQSPNFNPAAVYGLWYLRSHLDIAYIAPIQAIFTQ